MCGIAGIVVPTHADLPTNLEQQVRIMLESMQRRGPDSSGMIALPRAVVGACRLAILGLESASDQPIASPDSDLVLVFNGEVFNYLELRQELRGLGHPFKSTGDAEVVLHAYEEWGRDALRRFNGMFAFAVANPHSSEVFFARDRFGVKPFYFANAADRWLFGSEPLAIVRTGCIRAAMDKVTAAEYLRFGLTDTSERSFFEGVRQLMPGHCGVWDGERIRISQWYSPQPAEIELGSTGVHDRVGFRDLFTSSVGIRLRSDIPVGVLLSGGLDSSAVASIASHVDAGRAPPCFSVSFPGYPVDEAKYATDVANAIGASLTSVAAERLDLPAVEKCMVDQSEPFISPSVVAQWLVMEAVHKSGIRVLLSGQGADEYLCGYEYFDAYALADMIRHRNWKMAFRHLVRQPRRSRAARMAMETIFALLPPSMKSFAWRRRWLQEDTSPIEESQYFDSFSRARSLRDMQVLHLHWRLPELLRYEDRNSMAFSIETRQPFLDYRLVERALGMNDTDLVDEGVRKRILRLSMEGIVAPSVLQRRDKIGFQTPDDWLRSRAFRSQLDQMITQAPDVLGELIRFARVRKMVRKVNWRNHAKELWRVYSLLLWYERVLMPATRIRPSQ